MVSGGRGKRAHVLVMPFDEEGHFRPFVHVLYYLSTLDITVTFCSSKRRIEELRTLHRKGSFKDLDLRLVELSESICLPATVADGLPNIFDVSKEMRLQFQPFRDELVAEKNAASKPTIMIADTFLDWTEEMAEELQIPRYLLFTCSGWIPLAILQTKLEGWKKAGDEVAALPGYPGALAREVPVVLFPLCNVAGCAGVLINTFQELEQTGYDAALNYCKQLATTFGIKEPQYLPIGPVHLLPGHPEVANDGATVGRNNALQWLDKQAPASVVYIAFGTMAHVPSSLIFELARGLELSNVPFLWVLRLPHADDDISTILPDGFQARVGDRGYIETSFAPQLEMLQHSSTGGFVSHCGWNSVLEAINSGVPFLTWHLHGDQPMNARLLVDVLKVGLPIRKLGSSDHMVAGEVVASTVRSLMVDKDGQEIRENSARWKKKSQATLSGEGASFKHLQQFKKAILNQ